MNELNETPKNQVEQENVTGAQTESVAKAAGAVNEPNAWDSAPQPKFSTVASNGPMPASVPLRRPDTEQTKRMKENFGFFGPATLLYALFYAFCMYHNGSGVTFPFFIAGSLLFLCFSLSKLEISLKKGSAFYMISMMLLAVSTFCTDDWRIIAFNKTGIFLLMMSLLLKQYFDTSQWKLGKYFLAICQLVFASLGELGRPFIDASAHSKNKKKSTKIWYVVLGVVIAVPLMMIVLLLLTSADVVFRDMADKVFENISIGNIFNILVRITFLYFFSYILTAYLCKHTIREEVKDHRKGEPVLAITVTGMLSVLYLLFSVVQIVYLFLGQLKLPEEYTYAEYAREGFFQLLAVSILNLIIVLFVMSFFRESKVLKAVLTVMSLCTFIMIASSALRMIMYIQSYFLSFLRILVLWSLAVLAILFLGVVINIFKESFPLFRYSMVTVTILYLMLAFSHPDYIIARVNVENMRGEGWEHNKEDFYRTSTPYQDYRYLAGLNADAAPVLIPYLAKQGYDVSLIYEEGSWGLEGSTNPMRTGYYRDRVSWFGYDYLRKLQRSTKNFSLRTFNVSRYMAMKKVDKYSELVQTVEYFPGVAIHNDIDALFTRISYGIYIDDRYMGSEDFREEDIDAYFIETGDNGGMIDLSVFRVVEAEMPGLRVHITVKYIYDGETYESDINLTTDENGNFPTACALRGNPEIGFELVAE